MLTQLIHSSKNRPLIISGPCSAETEEQILSTAINLKNLGMADVFRAGVWKPRTRPGSFEGVGAIGLSWLEQVKNTTGLLVTTEVANTRHVEAALKHNIDILWIGARTTVNPFCMEEIAEALRGTSTTIMIKNPVSADVNLWMGAVERIRRCALGEIGLIHRGFVPYTHTIYRNEPLWDIAMEMKNQFPELPFFIDPSHISGNRALIPEILKIAMDNNYNGIFIESHINPNIAKSDSEQQLTPNQLLDMVTSVKAQLKKSIH